MKFSGLSVEKSNRFNWYTGEQVYLCYDPAPIPNRPQFSDMPELTDAQLAEMKPLPSGPSTDPDAHDTWLRAKVHEAVADSRPAIPHDQAMQKARALIINKRNA